MTRKNENKIIKVASSFRDPSGYVFYHKDEVFRVINQSYLKNYEQFTKSGLYQRLVNEKLIIPHKEIQPKRSIFYLKGSKLIKPEKIPFISYPYEWSFNQYKDAALSTLKTHQISLEYGMSLKDASAYNIQFYQGRPVLIDSLSFETYQENKPWKAYRQFCQHFLAPLALMCKVDIRLQKLMRTNVDGIPLDLTSKLLGLRTYLNFSLLIHIHLHSASLKKYANKVISSKKFRMAKLSQLGFIDNLQGLVNSFKWSYKGSETEWGDYYNFTNYSKKAFNHKSQVVSKYLNSIKPLSVWDLGANDGTFSRMSSSKKIFTLSVDADPIAVDKNYMKVKKDGEKFLLPLVFDLSNPSPSIGWQNMERVSLIDRGPADTVLALALIHHLAISNNIPFSQIAEFFSMLCKFLIIEFVPKYDSKVKLLLASRRDIFDNYNEKSFENSFSVNFHIIKKTQIHDSKRILYLMQRR